VSVLLVLHLFLYLVLLSLGVFILLVVFWFFVLFVWCNSWLLFICVVFLFWFFPCPVDFLALCMLGGLSLCCVYIRRVAFYVVWFYYYGCFLVNTES